MNNVVPLARPAPSTGKKTPTSYSRLKNFETCPRRYHEVDVLKAFKEDESDALGWGHTVHEALANRLSKGTALPVTIQRYEKEVEAIERVVERGAKLETELRLAFDTQFRATGFFDKATWFRGVADVLLLKPPKAWALDWKTGKYKVDQPQLALMAQCILSNYPEIEWVGTTFVWLGAADNGDSLYTTENYDSNKLLSVWNGLWPRFQMLQQAHDKNEFPPRESGLCKRYCPVTSCQFNGKRR